MDESVCNSEQVKLCPDGKYRWVYEYSLLKNPIILFTILKIFLCIILVGAVLLVMFSVLSGDLAYVTIGESLRFAALFVLFFLALCLVGYLLYALMQGGKYCVVFTMDETGILHKQLPKQYKKAQVVSEFNVLVGLATGNPTLAGIGLTSQRDALASSFESVKSIRGYRLFDTIKVNEPLAKNQVYVAREDYDFVFNYIVEHCPNAKAQG